VYYEPIFGPPPDISGVEIGRELAGERKFGDRAQEAIQQSV
jgi:hypothetical protein